MLKLLVMCALSVCLFLPRAEAQWRRHTIDASSRGADGVRLADVNGDSRQDLVCGWEEGGVIRVYLQPARAERQQPWPAVTAGQVPSPEDAVFADLDLDGNIDVLSSTEGRSRMLFVHWAPLRDKLLDPDAWKTEAIPAATGNQMWMFALPLELDGRPGPEMIVASKGTGATVSLLMGPSEKSRRRELTAYRLQSLYQAGWVMSLHPLDFDRDGDLDVLVSDRKGAHRGVLWLENPGTEAVRQGKPWREQRVAGEDKEVMFLDAGDFDGDDQLDIVTATRNGVILHSRQTDAAGQQWATTTIPNPFAAPNGKAVAIADVNLDGKPDLMHTANNGGNRMHRGAAWLERTAEGWKTHDISGERGVKFDLIQAIDIDEDGDLDLMTCEERDNLGLFWYENPTR
ncbi:MAG: VCBS repeat-containing protein [Planctomycetales bacterium]|nr:VCBS repeat-containing protein [Planctomycetales bacterium]